MTLEEVARRARVSTATVSRVLNGSGQVKKSTQARVLKVMQELKYSPNLHAQSLAGGRSRSIGVIVSNIENPFFLDVYKTVEAGAHEIDIDFSNVAFKAGSYLTGTFNVGSVSAVPEPSSFALAALGLAGVGFVAARSRASRK